MKTFCQPSTNKITKQFLRKNRSIELDKEQAFQLEEVQETLLGSL
ncbi:hypothetical protein MICAC_1520006 [Microcystis aeruginosa PCC 9443]|jgi:hypothetical protein|uniref:Uncharacterized protein n=1 Tax=Microcystis aeruginosa PCC 9443 TaxID=1160281 RepID=I4FZE1_MICAE|nr:hypothetical protein MICAC_1520006 [Microcystis aeruginosa PCC 9443]